jgi:DNA-binding ferritin-like protein
MPRSGSSSVKSGSSKSARNRRLKDKLNELKQKMDQVRSLWEKFDSILSGFVEKIFSKTLQDRETEEFLQNYRHNLDPLL